ncbi:MAG TPA: hypothetical protein VJ898_01770 [Natrialbaceae archaeon]|nr:hypothetical protein [Natrialbaceae archaeon]
MFEHRSLEDDLGAVRETHAPNTVVLRSTGNFETLPPERAMQLGPFVESFDPLTYDEAWVPPDAPEVLGRLAGGDVAIGAPGDGSIVWTRQTRPPVVIETPRTEGSPSDFVDFLVAEALVEVGLDVPEHFLGFFEESYRDLDDAVPLGPAATYQVAAALYDAWVGLQTRAVFQTWPDEHPRLGEAWRDAGERLQPRVSSLPEAVATGDTDLADGIELACSGVKHRLDLPAPFGALDVAAYRDRGAPYAVAWAEKVFDALDA